MEYLETLAHATRRLDEAGYTVQFSVQGDKLHGGDVTASPDEFTVDETVRFEGETDPSDEAALFALTHKATGTKGTYIVAYGPEMGMADADMAKRLG